MRLVVAIMDDAGGHRALDAMLRQGLPAVLVWSEAGAMGGGQVTLLVAVHDRDAADVCASLVAMATVTEPATHSLLPLSDPTDLHIGRKVTSAPAHAALFVLRLSRLERIW